MTVADFLADHYLSLYVLALLFALAMLERAR